MNTTLLIEQANVNTRSFTLFASGYRAMENMIFSALPRPIIVVNPDGEEYTVDPLMRTCTCAYFVKRNADRKPFDTPEFPCKHFLGANQLLDETEAESCEMDVETYRKWKADNEAKEALCLS